ncbi:imelysin family protein [Mucilaginibacter sp. UR6-11]|uniref:imelysin family protein n=1 Tax=Mucilaginibacter sp. UR6-11 TaxID=1435644 RepID=UPI001E579B0F|nr:imelysin family protein [Mucilaginibacter sp. UR6-11]MCC8424301.1 imelysin family protein [Mucilaginibacter sp. UR6-11]
MKKIICLALTAAVSLILIQSCSKSGAGDNNNNTGSSFDRKAMLTNISTNIIIPAYTSYQAAAVSLDAAVVTFNTTPTLANLTALQNAFTATYKQWQSTSVYDFGPAADVNLRVNTNTYPVDVNQINANVSLGTYNPQLLSNLAAKGLPALDYLLFNLGGDNAAVLALFTTDSKAANRKTYLAALSAELKTNATTVLNAWSGSYKTTFLNATGTDASSSTGYLVNQLVYDYEVLKNFEVGIPAGSQSMGVTYPTKVQAYYSKISLQLTLLHLQAIQNLYLGANGSGFDDYLVAANAKYNGGSLNDAIKAQFTTAAAKLQTLTDPLSANITNNPTAVMAAYTELQKLTVLLKTDMTSSLGIAITFGDNDGD